MDAVKTRPDTTNGRAGVHSHAQSRNSPRPRPARDLSMTASAPGFIHVSKISVASPQPCTVRGRVQSDPRTGNERETSAPSPQSRPGRARKSGVALCVAGRRVNVLLAARQSACAVLHLAPAARLRGFAIMILRPEN